ncbi:primosomal protein N' [Thioalkalivibrio paradoxus]|uniref:Replication restart protein PriA n=1 Tax=Thioalkalivibrio paradoxus ARh 1 TaxID=713585 RepID=W0DK30_9GAMM|nr:primosomal protein N' [Thioalkalivibrio paradoxus]AHE97235.1 primosomal protein N' [Thioalkalivibrio paradoxus ARh 1]
MPQETFVRVAIDRPLDRLFDYRCPPELRLLPGQRVRLPFGRSDTVGVVMESVATPAVATSRIRTVGALIDPDPVLTAPLLELLRFTARYYHHPLGEVVLNALPPALRRGAPLPGPRVPEPLWRADIDADPPRRIGPRQQATIDALREARAPLTREALNDLTGLGLRRAELERMADRGLLGTEPATVATTEPSGGGPAFPLTPEQRDALAEIVGASGQPGVLLLDGVTGSGKTEVYLEAAAQTLDQGGQVLILIPEIALTPQLIQRVSRRFPGQVAALHSGLAVNDRLRAWDDARRGERPLLLGTRSALFTPLPRLGLIIVDEEHDPAYKQQDGLHYHARDLAILRGHLESVPVVLGSATPTLETLEKARSGRYRHLRLGTRPDGSQPPAVHCLDTRVHPTDEGLSTPMLDAMRGTLAQGRQCFMLLNRRGFARVLSCDHCGWVADCPRCDAHLTVHAAIRRSVCHLCGYIQPLSDACPQCGQALRHLGVGTQRLERALSRHFPDTPLIRLDRDSIRRRGALEQSLEAIRGMEAGIVVGTQILAKGHDFPRVGLVGIIDVDQGLFSADLRAAEQTLQLVLQAAGRAGRAGDPGEVLIQTGHPEHPLMRALRGGDYAAMVDPLLDERHQAGMPPYGYLALIRIDGPGPEATQRQAEDMVRQLRRHAREVRVLGPAPAPRHRVNRRYREQILLASSRRATLHHTLGETRRHWEAHPPPRSLRISIDVDPITLA